MVREAILAIRNEPCHRDTRSRAGDSRPAPARGRTEGIELVVVGVIGEAFRRERRRNKNFSDAERPGRCQC
jgi:hypothetical protein